MSYPSDLTDEEWALVEPYLRTPRAHGGRPVRHDPRRLLDGILYVSDNANKWRALPQDFPR